MSDNSDYNKPRINIFELLPDVLKSDTNKAAFENLFNRFLTKQETRKVAGYIGEGNPDAIVSRQIQEFNVHRQGYQLQPILYDKIGSVEWMSSWYDILNEVERLGVDRELMQEWLNLLKFNWIPPVDIDKIIHYQDYYWYDADDSSSRPQYLTIRSRCQTATAIVNFQESLIEEFGETIPTIRAGSVTDPVPTFDVLAVNSPINTIVVSGDATAQLLNGQFFNLTGTASNNGIYQVTAPPVFALGMTSIPITSVGSPPIVEGVGGTVVLRQFDKLVVDGEFVRLFDPGFIFFYKDSTNQELNLSFFQVIESEFDSSANETIIQINKIFSDNTVDGVISQDERLQLAIASRDCQCLGSIGWGLFQWDDNPDDPLWDGDHETFIASISNAGPPVTGSPLPPVGDLWYDTVADTLYEFSGDSLTWEVRFNSFSLILADTTGLISWDFSDACGVSSVISAADQWVDQNKWFHKSDVPNFSIAKQAQLPIIEYDWDLELNEWTFTPYNWKYRESDSVAFAAVTSKPELIELITLDLWELQGSPIVEEIVLAEKYGDLTDYFTPGRTFIGEGVATIFEVEYSHFAADVAGEPFHTRIKLTVPVSTSGLVPASLTGSPIVPSITPLRPVETSRGDPWLGYGTQWLFDGAGDTLPVVHQPQNSLTVIPVGAVPTTHSSGDYEFTFTYYAQDATILRAQGIGSPPFAGVTDIELADFFTFPGSPPIAATTNISLNQRALIGTNDVRVYVNDVRQFGTYIELTQVGLGTGVDTTHVAGIRFLPTFELSQFDIVRIEVGEASTLDYGGSQVPVRTIEDDLTYLTSGNETVSLIEYRKEEQVKSELNQYPLFDMYRVDGTPAYQASPLFGFLTDATADVNPAVGLRLATDVDELDYIFQQFLVEDDGTMYAYRDYANQEDNFWVNPETEQVYFWDGFGWSLKTISDTHYASAVVSDVAPDAPFDAVDGIYWYDTLSQQLKQLSLGSPAGFTVLTDSVIFAQDDPTLQSIWRKGLNDELYLPEKRDWIRRSLDEYNAEMELFVEQRAEELVSSGLTEAEATTQATTEWFESQSNHLSLSGAWVGDWEIPDPLYFNVSHENREQLSFRELLTHFDTIVQAQPKIPGFNAPRENMFHLIPTNEVNYGLGGTIKEFNDGFDTFLSSIFINTVSPRALFEFAHDQYEALLNNLKELYRKEAVELFLDTTIPSLSAFAAFVTEAIIESHEQNDLAASLYGDSTTFTEVDGGDDIGIRNWIATLPYMRALRTVQPVGLEDDDLEINQVLHHDGHRNAYNLAPPVIEGIIQAVINTPDDRTRFPGPTDPPLDTFGQLSSTLPPNDDVEFSNTFATTILNREGVYWYQVVGTTRTLYRLTVVDSGPTEPATSVPDGSLWLDLTAGLEVLRVKVTDPNTAVEDWEVVDGLTPGVSPVRLHNGTNPLDLNTATISAWQVVDLNNILRDVVVEVEQRLFDNAPDPFELAYDFQALQSQYPVRYAQLLGEAFLSFVNQSEIQAPFANDDFTLSDAFTWNYKNSSFDLVSSPATVFPPSSDNTGSESGGDWRDLYEKLYGTPYPHLEPWRLQGYTSQPTWWNDEYLIDDPLNEDRLKWGDRRWKYKHGFDITGADIVDDYFEIAGDFREALTSGVLFFVDESPGVHDGLWQVGTFASTDVGSPLAPNITTGTAGNASLQILGDLTLQFVPGYKFAITSAAGELKALLTVTSSIFPGPNTIINVAEAILDATDFDDISGTTYDPATNRSRVYIDTAAVGSPSPQTSVTSAAVSGRIALGSSLAEAHGLGMWYNILIGVIPPGRDYPSGIVGVTGDPTIDSTVHDLPVVGELPTFNYFSVNIDNDIITTGGTFDSDDVFPPFWDHVAHFGAPISPIDQPIRTTYSIFANIVAPGADFALGDAGTIEWVWKSSSQFLYDQFSIAFQIDPVRFTFNTFGPEFHTIGGLFINERTEQVLSHTNTLFHGDLIETNSFDQVQFAGTNQWYVNFARFVNLDISMSDFRALWTLWTTPLMYQFSSFVDTPSFELAHRFVCISEFDYNITAKRSPGVEDFWLDSFEVVFVSVPPKIVRFDNDLDWELELQTVSPVGKTIDYYDVHNYQFYADPVTDICTLYTWAMTGVDTVNDTFSIAGDQTAIFVEDRTFEITDTGSPVVGNVGTYTTTSSAYNQITDETIITVDEDVTGGTVGGLITADYRSFPWLTGDRVVLSTTETFPIPLQGDNANGVYEYFVIRIDDTHLQLALTSGQAIAGNFVGITTVGRGDHFVGQTAVTFNTQRTAKNWRHYTVDTSTLLQFTPPYDVRGLQTVVNIIDGYDVFTREQGWRVNSNNSLQDFDQPSRFVSWQLEQERMIDFAEGLRTQRRVVGERYEATVNVGGSPGGGPGSPLATADVWTFVGPGFPQFITADPVSVLASGNVYPPPLALGRRYYMIRDSLTQFRLAGTVADAQNGVAIDITSLAGVGQLFITEASNLRKDRPMFEVDPFRNGIWFRPERGIVSNVLQGPVEDVFNTQLLLDQYSRPLGSNTIRVFRQDEETELRISEGVFNDVQLSSVFDSPYNFLHLAACHLFVDTYEHVLIFNNNTTEGNLLYDPFIGLNVTKFETLFNRQLEFTQRPNVGGQYLSTFFNQGAELKRNIEASVDDLRLLYDTYQVIEANPLTQFARKTLGYEGREEYLDNLNLSAKSQFAFWRGQIQAKGSINAVNAFVNSRRFIDARVDEFWAYKVADFGSAKEKEYVSMYLSTTDTRSNDLRLQFVVSDAGSPTELESGFQAVSLTDTDRWFDQPDQLETLRNNGGTLYFELKPTSMIPFAIQPNDPATTGSPPSSPSNDDGWIDTSADPFFTCYRWNSTVVVSGSPFEAGAWEFQGSWDASGSPTSNLPIFRHGTKSDFLTITLDWYPAGKQETYFTPGSPSGSPTITQLTIDGYISSADSIRVFKDGVQLIAGLDYTEVVVSGQLLSTQLNFVTPIDGSTIDVVYKTSSLQAGVHFTQLTSDIVQLNFYDLIADVVESPTVVTSIPTNFQLWGWIIDKEAQNPAKIIDTTAEVVIDPVQIWDPARGFHYFNGIHVVELQRDSDPAIYSDTPVVDQTPLPFDDFVHVYNDPWNQQEVGTTWLDTTNLDYTPYYDTFIVDSIEDRSRQWGTLAAWGDVKINTWIESDVPPSEWDALAALEEGDISIPEDQRKSGTALLTLFEFDANGDPVVLTNTFDEFDVLIDGQGAGTNVFTLSDISPAVRDITVVETGTELNSSIVTFDGYYEQRLLVDTEAEVDGSTYTVTSVEGDTTAQTTTVTLSGGAREVTTIDVSGGLTSSPMTFVGSPATAGNLGGKYFTIDSPSSQNYVWYNINRPEVTTFDFTGVTGAALTGGSPESASTPGDYFDFDTPTTKYRFWFSDGGTVDPVAAGRISVPVIFDSADTDEAIVSQIISAFGTFGVTDATAEFGGSPLTAILIITNVEDGDVPDASVGTSPATITSIIQGVSSTDPAPAGRTSVPVVVDFDATPDEVATATNTALDAIDGLSSSFGGSPPLGSPPSANIIYVTTDNIFDAPDAADVDTGFTISVIQQGISPSVGDTITFYSPANIYVNGSLLETNRLIPVSGLVTVNDLRTVDQVRVMQLVPTDPSVIEAEVEGGMLLQEYQFTTDTVFDSLGIERAVYYFWIENKSTRSGRILTPREAQIQLQQIPIPYVFFQNVEDNLSTTFGSGALQSRREEQFLAVGQTTVTTGLPISSVNSVTVNGTELDPTTSPGEYTFVVGSQEIQLNITGTASPVIDPDEIVVNYIGTYDPPVDLPIRFTQTIIRGLRGVVTDDFRYILRWTRDFTLRDSLETGATSLQNKNLHEQWLLIRREQLTNIPRELWNKITEAIVGFELTDPATRVPSLERELYDVENIASTRIGLGDGQALADGQLALATILADLNNPDNDFTPVDINVFFQNNSFDTPANIIASMNTIYNTFSFVHVNRMFFDVLLDGLSSQDKYADIFKTSMIALHGIRPFQTAGIFDD